MKKLMSWLTCACIILATNFIFAQPPVPNVSGDNVVCFGDTAVMTASVTPADTTLTYRWYDNLIGGAPLFIGNPFKLGPITSARTIFCEAVDTNGFVSLIRAPHVIVEILNVDIPSATLSPPSLCPGDTITLTGQSLTGADTYNWYQDALDVTPLFTGNSFITPLTTSTTYHLEAVNSFGCRSIRTPIIVPVVPNLDLPAANASPNLVCPGDSILLTVVSLNGSTTFNWYDSPIAGNRLETNDSLYVTPDSTELFYVASESTHGCESVRTPVLAVVAPNLDIPIGIPSKLIACPDDTITLTGTSLNGSSTFKWYDDPAIDGNLLHTGQIWTTTISSTTTYWLETENANGCPSGRTGVLVTVLPNLDIPFSTVDPFAFCPGDTLTITGFSLNGSSTFDWYDHPLTGSLLYSGNPYFTTTTNAETYWLSTRNSAGCKSIRTPIAVTPIPNIDVPLATATPISACPGDSVTFEANSLVGHTNFRWYDSPLGGSLLHEGKIYETTAASTLTVYVESVNSIGCGSIRTPIVAVVLPNLDVPIAVATPFAVCPGDTVIFNGISPAGYSNLFWYDQQQGGNLVASGTPYITTIDTATTLFLESQNANGCPSIRTSSIVLVNRNLDIPVATASSYIACVGDSVTLYAQSTVNAIAYNWYLQPIGGNAIGSGTAFQTTTDSSMTFWLESIDSNGCPSLRSPVAIVVYPNHDIPLSSASPPIVCAGDSMQLTGQSINGSLIFNWYDTLFSQQPTHVGQSFDIAPDGAKIYYLETVNGQGCKSIRTPITILVNRNTDLPEAYATPLVICSGDSSLLTGASLQLHNVFHWYDSIEEGNFLFDGVNEYVSPITTTTYYVESVDDDGCSSQRTPIIVEVSGSFDSLNVSSNFTAICDSGDVTLSVSSSGGAQNFKWYSSNQDNQPIGAGSNLSVNINSDSTFYVESVNQSGCSSTNRDSVSVDIISNKDSLTVSVSPSSICPGAPVTLSVQSSNGSTDFNWYDAPISGNQVGQGLFISPTVNITSVFYVSSMDSNGCNSSFGSDTVLVHFNAEQPSISAPSDSVCSDELITLIGNSPGGNTLKWYDAPLNGSLLHVGDTYDVVFNNATTIYLESVNSTGCSSNRDSISLFVSDPASFNTTSADTSICEGDFAELYAKADMPGTSINWYDEAIAGNTIASGETFTSQVLTTDTTFWVEAESDLGCKSSRFAIQVTIVDRDSLGKAEIECSTPQEREILVTWNPVNNAVGYEVSIDDGQTWVPTGSINSYLITNLGSEESIEILVKTNADPSLPCIIQDFTLSEQETCISERFDDNGGEGGEGGGPGSGGNDIDIPYNSFSPNNDGFNDHWNIGEDVTKYGDNQVQIFNRIGEPVFVTEGYDNISNFFTGEGLADGTYYYVVKIPSIGFTTSGYLLLSR